MRLPSEVSWSKDMEEPMENAQAFIMAMEMGDEEAQRAIVRHFIEPMIKNDNIELLIYAISTVCLMHVRQVCKYMDFNVKETLEIGVEAMNEERNDER